MRGTCRGLQRALRVRPLVTSKPVSSTEEGFVGTRTLAAETYGSRRSSSRTESTSAAVGRRLDFFCIRQLSPPLVLPERWSTRSQRLSCDLLARAPVDACDSRAITNAKAANLRQPTSAIKTVSATNAAMLLTGAGIGAAATTIGRSDSVSA